MKYQISVGDKRFEVSVGDVRDGSARVTVDAVDYVVTVENWAEITNAGHRAGAAPPPTAVTPPAAPMMSRPGPPATAGGGVIRSPIPGLILEVLVRVGDGVVAGQVVAKMEAMKMENNITCMAAGTVREIKVQKGTEVATGDVLMIID